MASPYEVNTENVSKTNTLNKSNSILRDHSVQAKKTNAYAETLIEQKIEGNNQLNTTKQVLLSNYVA